ncbi:MAG TPA: cytochrome c biogenesis protein ResB, partial [Desulfobacteria bacterium]|nr:cytochrome c biogenesis protein ResB [Desulfobacteria bacterium]
MSEQEKLVRVPPIWRGLASMRLGLMLMFLLAVAATIGVLTPQGVLSQNTVLAQIANALGLNQVFSTWWFRALAYLLGANVLACFLNRFNAAINVARSPQVSVAAMERLQYYRTFTDKASPDQVIDRVIQVFQANRYRVLQGQDEEQNLLYADKQRLAVLGPVIAHLGLMLLLAGLVWSSLSGFDGQITVASGQTFKLSEINLTRGTVDQDQDLKLQSAERLISNANLWDARSSLSIMDNGKVVKTGNLGYNAPLNYNGYSVHQVAFIDGVVIDVQDGNIVSPYLVRNVNNQEAVRLA